MKDSFVVINVPHASTYIPTEETKYFNRSCLSHEIKVMTDHYCDDLFDIGFDMNTSTVSRLVCDMERFRNDADEIMSKCGMGAVYTRCSDGQVLRRIGENHKEEILRKYYDPYHKNLTELVRKKVNTYGKCLIIDGHSFYPVPLSYELDKSENRSDICIGTDSFHTPDKLVKEMKASFEKRGYSVSINTPFSGTIVPMEFYRTDTRVWSVMIEINRKLYIDEFARKNEGYHRLKKDIDTVIKEVLTGWTLVKGDNFVIRMMDGDIQKKMTFPYRQMGRIYSRDRNLFGEEAKKFTCPEQFGFIMRIVLSIMQKTVAKSMFKNKAIQRRTQHHQGGSQKPE